jgi:hypothetical protein
MEKCYVKQKSSQSGDWVVRLVPGIFGLYLMLVGFFEYKQGHFWHVSFSERFGRPTFTPSLQRIALGIIFLLVGILPWRRISNWLERRDSAQRNSKHNH